jgi:hypothetical protein
LNSRPKKFMFHVCLITFSISLKPESLPSILVLSAAFRRW